MFSLKVGRAEAVLILFNLPRLNRATRGNAIPGRMNSLITRHFLKILRDSRANNRVKRDENWTRTGSTLETFSPPRGERAFYTPTHEFPFANLTRVSRGDGCLRNVSLGDTSAFSLSACIHMSTNISRRREFASFVSNHCAYLMQACLKIRSTLRDRSLCTSINTLDTDEWWYLAQLFVDLNVESSPDRSATYLIFFCTSINAYL